MFLLRVNIFSDSSSVKVCSEFFISDQNTSATFRDIFFCALRMSPASLNFLKNVNTPVRRFQSNWFNFSTSLEICPSKVLTAFRLQAWLKLSNIARTLCQRVGVEVFMLGLCFDTFSVSLSESESSFDWSLIRIGSFSSFSDSFPFFSNDLTHAKEPYHVCARHALGRFF